MKRLFKGARKPALGLNSSGGRTETAGSSAALAVSSATVTSRREWIEHSIGAQLNRTSAMKKQI